MDIVRPAVQEDDWFAISGANLGIADIQDACVNLLERGK
jgi:hypothetical protein